MSFISHSYVRQNVHTDRNNEALTTQKPINDSVKSGEKPNLFQRAWQHVTPKNVLKVAAGLVLAAGYVALWVFCPPAAIVVTLKSIKFIVLYAACAETLKNTQSQKNNSLDYYSDYLK